MTEAAEDVRACGWCGKPLPPGAQAAQQYCNQTHSRKAQKVRSIDSTSGAGFPVRAVASMPATSPPGLPLTAVVVAADLLHPGTYGWAMMTSGQRVCSGTVQAVSFGETDPLIADALEEALPERSAVISLGLYRGPGSKHYASGSAGRRPWEAVDRKNLLPACDEVVSKHSEGLHVSANTRARMRAAACAAFPVVPVHPCMPRVSLPAEHISSPWTVATDGSAMPGGAGLAAWAVVSGAGWADSGVMPYGTQSTAAEFAAYCRALAMYPDGAPVTLITDSRTNAVTLEQLAQADKPLSWKSAGPLPQDEWNMASFHARRLRLNVEWRRRNTHPLQAAAHRLCNAARKRR